jgi:hypothetical protein
MGCIVYTMSCNFVPHATCPLTFTMYKYNKLQVSFATKKWVTRLVAKHLFSHSDYVCLWYYHYQFWKKKSIASNPSQLKRSPISWSFTHSKFVTQFKNIFVEHFSLHYFGLSTWRRCEKLVHRVCAMLELHPHWVLL